MTVGTPVTKVTLDKSKATLAEKQKLTLKATLTPKKPGNKKLLWTSSNTKIAKIDSKGTVTITATAEDSGKKTAAIEITILPRTTDIVESVKELLASLKEHKSLKQITLKGKDAQTGGEIEAPEDTDAYQNIDLIVDAPKAHIENHAGFHSIRIDSIGKDTFVEHASGNKIIYAAPQGKIEVAETASADITVSQGAGELNLVNNGISKMTVDTKADVKISGNSGAKTRVTLTENAEKTVIDTSQKLTVSTVVPFHMNLQTGSENSTVYVEENNNKPIAAPTAEGVGSFVCIRRHFDDEGNSTITDKNTVYADNNGTESDRTVRVQGSIFDTSDAAVAEAGIYVFPYSQTDTKDSLAAKKAQAIATLKTNSDGAYQTDSIPRGNYNLYVEAEGYASSVTTTLFTLLQLL